MEKRDIQPSMKRRMLNHDYTERNIYLITLSTEDRIPFFGTVEGSADAPRMVPSDLGLHIISEVERIPAFYPQIKILGKQLMPDHLHFILYVTEQLPVPLGTVINGFKAGCRKVMRAMFPSAGVACPSAGVACPSAGVACPSARVACPSASRKGKGTLWEKGYNDRILYGKGQLQAMIAYIHDNPRRLLLKRSYPQYYRHDTTHAAGTLLYAYGNIQLLSRPVRLPVKCSRSQTYNDFQKQRAELMQEGKEGAVLVSPFISNGERLIEDEAIKEGINIIKLTDNGFSPFYKPQGRYFDLCATGRLLLLSPFEYHTENVPLTRAVCMQLNELALALCR